MLNDTQHLTHRIWTVCRSRSCPWQRSCSQERENARTPFYLSHENNFSPLLESTDPRHLEHALPPHAERKDFEGDRERAADDPRGNRAKTLCEGPPTRLLNLPSSASRRFRSFVNLSLIVLCARRVGDIGSRASCFGRERLRSPTTFAPVSRLPVWVQGLVLRVQGSESY